MVSPSMSVKMPTLRWRYRSGVIWQVISRSCGQAGSVKPRGGGNAFVSSPISWRSDVRMNDTNVFGSFAGVASTPSSVSSSVPSFPITGLSRGFPASCNAETARSAHRTKRVGWISDGGAMRGRCLPMGILGVVLVTLLASGACGRARPITYPIAPGISASFPPSQMKASVDYAKTFCSVLAEPAFAGERWETCDRYVKMPAATSPEALPEPNPNGSWTLLILGGFSAQCFVPNVIAFNDAAEHLRDKHAINFHHLDVDAFGSSERNAELIRDQLRRLSESQFIVVAHSKGAADIMVALTKYPAELQRIKAFITV